MTVYINRVDGTPHSRTGKTRWLVAWRWTPGLTSHYDGTCYSWSDWEASVCQRAKEMGQAVALETVDTAWGQRVQAVCLASAGEVRA